MRSDNASSAFPQIRSGVNAGAATVCGRFTAENTKGRSLGERPAFLRSPPGCGVIEALGCVGRGTSMSGLGAAGGLGGTLLGAGALGWEALPNWVKCLSEMNYDVRPMPLMKAT